MRTHIAVVHLDPRITPRAHSKTHRPTPDRPFATFGSPLKLTQLLSRWTFTTTHCSHRKGLAVINFCTIVMPLVCVGLGGEAAAPLRPE